MSSAAHPLEPAPVSPEVLQAFAKEIEARFGFCRTRWRADSLRRRLSTAMELAGAVGEDPSRFVERLRASAEGSSLLLAVAEALPNHETSFFRDVDQLELVIDRLLPEVVARSPRGGPLRVLSVGCSSGEEVFSLGMLLFEKLEVLWGRRVELWGADLSPWAIARAREATFPASAIHRAGNGPRGWAERFFRRDGGRLIARELLRCLCRFEQANLAAPSTLEPLGHFDVVLCRNVLIYFSRPALERAFAALLSRVGPHGAVVLGRPEAGLVEVPERWVRREGSILWFAPNGGEA